MSILFKALLVRNYHPWLMLSFNCRPPLLFLLKRFLFCFLSLFCCAKSSLAAITDVLNLFRTLSCNVISAFVDRMDTRLRCAIRVRQKYYQWKRNSTACAPWCWRQSISTKLKCSCLEPGWGEGEDHRQSSCCGAVSMWVCACSIVCMTGIHACRPLCRCNSVGSCFFLFLEGGLRQ